MSTKTDAPETEQESFAETAFRLSGKSETEAKKIGAVDRADDQVEAMFAKKYQTTNSPAHKAVWDKDLPIELFTSQATKPSAACEKAMKDSLEVVARHKKAGDIYDDKRKVSPAVLKELGDAGYWGMLVDPQYGGQGAPFTAFAKFLSKMSTIDATVSGLASV